jgi:hypothetical protein
MPGKKPIFGVAMTPAPAAHAVIVVAGGRV